MKQLAVALKEHLASNNGKISPSFIQSVANTANVIYQQVTPSMRICVLQLPSGHEVYGVAQVLDPKNDVEAIGNAVAYKNAVEELWKVCGNIAKIL